MSTLMALPKRKIKELEDTLPDLDPKAMTYSLADAIREGATVSDQLHGGWVDGDRVCALSAAALAAKARHLI